MCLCCEVTSHSASISSMSVFRTVIARLGRNVIARLGRNVIARLGRNKNKGVSLKAFVKCHSVEIDLPVFEGKISSFAWRRLK